ncbi:MAG: hypothetical protein LBT00_08260 [Spirochaetaceae bacterium]|nr:hypothetical protein [Spirochaetaceae bacterium]
MLICRVNTTYRRLCYLMAATPPLCSNAALRWCSPGRNDNTEQHTSFERVLFRKRQSTGVAAPNSTPLDGNC